MTSSLEDSLTQATLATVQRFNEAFNTHDVEAVMALMTGDCVFESTRPPPDGERVEGKERVEAYWNAFFQALLYLGDAAKWPLQLVARQYVLQGSPILGSVAYSTTNAGNPPPTEAMEMAVVVVAIVPILIVYPFLQKYFTQGVLTGAIKG